MNIINKYYKHNDTSAPRVKKTPFDITNTLARRHYWRSALKKAEKIEEYRPVNLWNIPHDKLYPIKCIRSIFLTPLTSHKKTEPTTENNKKQTFNLMKQFYRESTWKITKYIETNKARKQTNNKKGIKNKRRKPKKKKERELKEKRLQQEGAPAFQSGLVGGAIEDWTQRNGLH